MHLKTIAIAGTFDSKGHEYAYVKDLIESLGLNTLTINTGVLSRYLKQMFPTRKSQKRREQT